MIKRIIYITVFLILSVSAKAQIVVPTIQKMVDLSSAAKNTTVIVTDSVRGGMFKFTRETQTIDSGVVFQAESAALSGGYFVRMFEGSPKPQWYNINVDGTANDSTILYNFLQYHKRNQICVEWGEGTISLPVAFRFDFGDTTMCFIGEGIDKTIITQNSGVNSLKYPKPIDVTKGKPADDGVYRIEINGSTISSDYSGLDSTTLDSYVRILNGTPSNISLSTVKSLNYVTDVDASGTEPSIAGLYVVSALPNALTGGFTMDSLSWANSVKVIYGTIVQRSAEGVWTQYNNGNLFSFSGDAIIDGVKFNDLVSFVLDPNDKTTGRHLSMTNTAFERVYRVFSPQFSGAALGATGVINHYNSYAPQTGFGFDDFTIENCSFDQIHQSIAWYIPSPNRIVFKGNSITNSPNMPLSFYAISILGSTAEVEAELIEVAGNFYYGCRNAATNSENRILLKMGVGTKAYDNIVRYSDGIFFFFQEDGVSCRNNTVEPFPNNTNNNVPVFFLKGATNGYPNEISSNKILGGFNPGVYVNHGIKTTVIGNDFRLGNSIRYVTTRTDGLDKKVCYTIEDTATFFSLAGSGNYAGGIVDGNTVYYNPRRSRWETITPNISAAFSNGTTYNIDIEWISNYTSCRNFQSSDVSPINSFKISNSTIITNTFSGTPSRDFSKTLAINNSKVETYNQSTIIANQIWIENTTMNSSHRGQFIIDSDTNIYLSNCNIGYVEDIHNTVADFGATVPLFQDKIVFNAANYIFINGCHVSSDDARTRAFSIEGAKRLYVNNNFFDCYVTNTISSVPKEVIEIATTSGSDTLNLIDFSNNTIKFPTGGTGDRDVFSFISDVSYGIDTVIIDNILLANPFEQVDNIIDSGNANITGVDYLRLGIEWEAANSLPAYVTETYRPNERNSSGVLYITTTSLNDTLAFYQLIPDVITSGTSRNLASADVENRVRCTTSITLTIPLNFSAMAVEQTITILKAFSGTNVTVTGASGVTVNGSSGGSATITGDYKAGIIYKVSTNTYEVY